MRTMLYLKFSNFFSKNVFFGMKKDENWFPIASSSHVFTVTFTNQSEETKEQSAVNNTKKDRAQTK